MRITRILATVSLAAALAVTGCDSGDDQGADSAGGPQPASQSDGGGDNPLGEQGEGEGGEQEAPEPDVEDVPDVVAEVNGEEISKDDFVASYESQFQQAAMQQQSTGEEVDQDELKKQVADLLVDNELLSQAAQDAGIEATDKDVDATLDEIAQQNQMGSADELISAMEQQGTDEKQIREDAANQYQLNEFISQEADVEEPSEKELKQQYDEMKEMQESQGGGQGGEQQEVPPFEEVKDQLAEQATQQEESEAANKIAEDLREDADVTINL